MTASTTAATNYPVEDSASTAEAIQAAKDMPLTVTGERYVSKVDDIDSASGKYFAP